MRRQKTIKHGATFDCGLEAQLERSPYKASGRKVELTVTLPLRTDIPTFRQFVTEQII